MVPNTFSTSLIPMVYLTGLLLRTLFRGELCGEIGKAFKSSKIKKVEFYVGNNTLRLYYIMR